MKKISLLLALFCAPLFSHAQFRDVMVTEVQSTTSPLSVAGDVITWLCGLAIFIALIRLISMGIWYLTSEGDENRNAKAKEVALFHGISLVVALIIFALIFAFGK